MADKKRKIVNDPVYGFITINDALVFSVIDHPFYQRLRRIHQMALAQLVYPGAVHTRLHHSLGAYHLVCNAVNELRAKSFDVTYDEEVAVKCAILLHDVGHGPFSHALENVLIPGVHHEDLSLLIMNRINEELGGALNLAISIFTNQYHKTFLHQLVSSQLDVDRMDYLTRDSFFTGVSEGVIGYDRILKMLTVKNNELLVEEKGIYSVEKFLIARRQMYWQVYLHKTVVAAEKMLVNIITRVKELYSSGDQTVISGSSVDYFLKHQVQMDNAINLDHFCALDDNDVMFSVKQWSTHPDKVLRILCTGLLNRKLLKCKLLTVRDEAQVATKRSILRQQLNLTDHEASYLVFDGEATNTTYKIEDEHIKVLFKDGSVRDISQVDNPLIHQTLSSPVKKFYICSLH